MRDRITLTAFALMLAALVAGCDKVPLLAPSGSQITLSANAANVPTGGIVGLTAFVTESSGTPVQNGTTVRFTTNLGTVTPAEVQTTNGLAVASFNAGSASGVATVTAISGGATGTVGTGTTATPGTNTVKITIGAAAVGKITVSANPASVGPSGGTSAITAVVLDANGGTVAGVPVSFSSDQGVIAPSTVTTDASGQARTTLTSSVATIVTATSGSQSATVTVAARPGPGITITCAVASGTGTTCASVQANASTNTVTVTFTVTKGTGSSSLSNATLNFGDGNSQSLGNLSGGSVTVSHVYSGPSAGNVSGYTATVTAVDVNGESSTASTTVTVTSRQQLAVTLSGQNGTPSGGHTPVNFTATVTPATGGADSVQQFEWDFGDGDTLTTSGNTTTHQYVTGSGVKTATVKVTTTDGRTATGSTQVNP